jgi:hypothetical protein
MTQAYVDRVASVKNEAKKRLYVIKNVFKRVFPLEA